MTKLILRTVAEILKQTNRAKDDATHKAQSLGMNLSQKDKISEASSISPIRDPSFLQGGEEEAMDEEEEAKDEEEDGILTENVPDNNHPNRSLHVPALKVMLNDGKKRYYGNQNWELKHFEQNKN